MAPPIVRTISRYLLRQHVAPLVFALAALTSLMLIQQVAKQLSGLLGKGLPPGVIAEVFVLSLPFIVAVTLPMAVLVAVLHVFTRLAGDNEMTALQAGGVSVARVVAPVLAGATGVALLSFLWNDQLLPRTNHELRTLQVDIARKKPSLTLKEQVINEVVPGQFFLRAARIDGNTNKLKDVTIYDLGDAERRRIITADSGRMAYAAGGRDLFLTLTDGDIEEVNRTDPTQFNRTFYRTNRMRVSGVGNIFVQTEHDTYNSAREVSTSEMRLAATYEVEIQKKYAIATACLVFALVGVPVALRFQRGGVGLVIGVSVAVFAVYYVGLIVGEDLGDQLIVSPFLAMWTPNLIFAAAGVFGLWRIRKPGNAPHGGDWSDVVEALRRVVSWPGSLLRPAWRSPR